MVNVSIDVTDLGGEARPGDKVVFWRPRMGGSATHAGRVISTAPVTVFLTNGKATVSNVEPGEMTVLLQCRGVESQGPVTVGVPNGNGTVTLRSLIESQFEYAPPIVSAVQEAAANASASERAAIQAQVRSEAAADRADAKVDDAINNGAALVRDEVKQDADRAVSARQAATQSESNAKASEDAAATSESNAAASENAAKQSETNAGDYAAVATTATTEAVNAMEVASEAASSIGDSVSRAAASADSASQSETNAAQYESSAATHAQNATEAATKVGTAAELDAWARAAQEAADRVGTAEQVGAWASESSAAALRAETAESSARSSEESAATSATEAGASRDSAAGSALEAGSYVDTIRGHSEQAEQARNEVVPLAQQVATDASATAAHRAHVDSQVSAIDTAFTESVPPYLQPESLESATVSAINQRLPEYTIGPTGVYATVDDFLVNHPTGGAKIVLQAGKHYVNRLPSDGSLANFVMTGQGSIWGTAVKHPQEVTTVETSGPLIDTASGPGNLRFSDFNLRNLTEENTDHGLRFSYPKGVTVERLNIYGFGGSSIWLAGGLDSEVFDNYIIAKDFSGNNGFAGIHISKLTDNWNSANTTTHLQRNYVGSSGNYGFYFEGVSRGTISTGDIAEGCQVGFHFHRSPVTAISPYTEANAVGMESLDCSPLIIGATRDELIQEWSTQAVSIFDRGAVRIAEKYIDMGKGITMSMRDGNQSGDFDNSMSIRSGTLAPNGYYTAPAGSMYFMRGGTNGKTLWQKHTNGGNTGWLPIGHFTVSESEITSASSWLNTNKTAGMTVWCHDLSVLVYTEGSAASSPWINVRTGETVATPV